MVNSSGGVVQALIALVTVPLFIHHIGNARYGVLALVWILLGYFGFLDFGLSRASTNALSRRRDASKRERAQILMTVSYLLTGFGLAASLILFFAGRYVLTNFVHLDPELAREVNAAFPWIVLTLPIGMLAGAGTGALESTERFVEANCLQVTGYLLAQLPPVLCAVFVSPSLALLVPAALAGRVVSTVLVFLVVARREGIVQLTAFDRTLLPRLFGYGAWVSVTNILSPILDGADQLMVGWLLGAASVAYYTVPMNLASRTQLVAAALARTVFPRLSHLDRANATETAADAMVALAYGFGMVCSAGMLLIGPFLRLWMDPDFAAHATPVGVIVLLGAWINGVAYIPFALLQAQGRPDLIAKSHAVEFVPFVLLLLGLTYWLGLPGAALAWTLRVAIDCILLLTFARFPPSLARRLLAPTVMVLATGVLLWSLHTPISVALVVATSVGLGLTVLVVPTDLALQVSRRRT